MEGEKDIQLPQGIYFIPPPINETFPKYAKNIENQGKDIKHLTNQYTMFGIKYPFIDQHPQHYQNVKVTKEELKVSNAKIIKKIIKCIDLFSGQNLESKSNLQTNKILEESELFFNKCRQYKINAVRQSICQIIVAETKEIRQFSSILSKELEEMKHELSKKQKEEQVSELMESQNISQIERMEEEGQNFNEMNSGQQIFLGNFDDQ